ncbi:hypothetical protein PTKIN_Ptkin09bG0151200 [Pterospermum kingtungense]
MHHLIELHFQALHNSAQIATFRTTTSKPARQLGELLQEQQEPFILEVYLSERRCVGKNTTSGANSIYCHGNPDKFRKNSGTRNKRKKGIPHFPTVLKFVCNKFLTIKGLRAKNSDEEDGKPSIIEMDRNNRETAGPDSSTRVYDSSSDSDTDEPSKFADNSKSKRKENIVLSVGVTDNANRLLMQSFNGVAWDTALNHCLKKNLLQPPLLDNSRRGSSTMQKSFLPKLITEDSILSASLWNVLLQTTPERWSFEGLTELQGPDSSNSSQLSISKEELVDNNHGKEVLGSEEIGKAIGEKIKGCGEESNIQQLLESDILDSTQGQEWNDFESQKRDIGNAIAEEITDEVVMDMMINFLVL